MKMKRELVADIRAIVNASGRPQAEARQCKTIEKYAQGGSKLADWLEGNISEGLTFFNPEAPPRQTYTVNYLERMCPEIRRWT